MSALAIEYPPTATEKSSILLPYPALLERMIEAFNDKSSYESHEDIPDVRVVITAVTILASLPVEYIQELEIEPYFGEINVTWRLAGKRVKLICGPQSNAVSVYRELMDNGRVTGRDIISDAQAPDIEHWLDWLHA